VTALESIGATQFGDYVASLAWHPNGTMLAVACADGTVHEMLAEGAASSPVREHRGGACAVAYSAGGVLASAGEDGRVGVGPLAPQPVGAGWVEILGWSPDGGVLATAVGPRVQFWNAAGALVAESAAQPATVECLAWSPDSTRVAVGGHGGVALMDREGDPVGERIEWVGVVLSLAWAPDGRRLACGMQDCTAWVWDLEAMQASTMTGFARKLRELSWSDGGRWLVTGGGSAPVAWHFAEGGFQADGQIDLRGHEKPVVWAGFQPGGGGLLATAGEDGVVILWQLPEPAPLTGATIGEAASVCAWSADGQRLALAGETGRVAVFSLV
jgi:WD40 repeat protein